MAWPDDYDQDDGGAGGNGGGHRRRRADRPSKVDRAAKRATEGCLLPALQLSIVALVVLVGLTYLT